MCSQRRGKLEGTGLDTSGEAHDALRYAVETRTSGAFQSADAEQRVPGPAARLTARRTYSSPVRRRGSPRCCRTSSRKAPPTGWPCNTPRGLWPKTTRPRATGMRVGGGGVRPSAGSSDRGRGGDGHIGDHTAGRSAARCGVHGVGMGAAVVRRAGDWGRPRHAAPRNRGRPRHAAPRHAAPGAVPGGGDETVSALHGQGGAAPAGASPPPGGWQGGASPPPPGAWPGGQPAAGGTWDRGPGPQPPPLAAGGPTERSPLVR